METESETIKLTVPYLSKKKNLDASPGHGQPKDGISAVFDHWVETCRPSGRGRRPVLDDKRRRAIKKAIKLYDVETCLAAIDGVTLSDFHQGGNSRGKKYDELTLILRDSEHIEMFANLTDDPVEAWLNE